MKQKRIEKLRQTYLAWDVLRLDVVDTDREIVLIESVPPLLDALEKAQSYAAGVQAGCDTLHVALEEAQRIADERLLTIGEYAELNVVKNAEIARLQESQAAAHCDLSASNVALEEAQEQNDRFQAMIERMAKSGGRLRQALQVLYAKSTHLSTYKGITSVVCDACNTIGVESKGHASDCPFRLLEVENAGRD